MNKILIIGRLTADPTLRYTPAGVAVTTFTLAVDRRFAKEGQQKTDFISCVVWSKQGEACANFLKKGSMAAVNGELHIRSYDGNDGQKRWVTEVQADQVKFLTPKSSNTNISDIGQEVSFSDDQIPF